MVIFKEPLRNKLIGLLEARTYKDPNTGCFIWNGTVHPSGQGQICYLENRYYVHRLAMALFMGFDLDSEALVCHKLHCSTASCWNPDHLYIGNHRENLLDKYQKIGGLRTRRELY